MTDSDIGQNDKLNRIMDIENLPEQSQTTEISQEPIEK